MADKFGCINANPDIAGIGIRINFYTTVVVAILTREKKYTEDLLCGIYKNAVINCLSLLLTAVIQTIQGKLDLYHAVVVANILFYFHIVFLFGERRFLWSSRTSQSNFQIFIYLLMHTFGVIVFLIWFLYVEINANTFGSQPSCNHYVVDFAYFAKVRATVTWFRVMMIVLTYCGIFLLLLILGCLMFSPPSWKKACGDTLQRVFEENPHLWLIRYLIGIPLAVYIVAFVELIIHRNRPIIQPGENEWGFGQIIAVVLTLGIFVDIVAAVREWRRTRKPEAPTRPEALED